MSGLGVDDRNDLVDLIAASRDKAPRLSNDADSWDVLDAITPTVEAIVARRVREALTEAAERIEGRFLVATAIEPHDPLPLEFEGAERNGWLSGLKDSARIVRDLTTDPCGQTP